MKPINYGLSFISGKWPENSVRLWVESRLRIICEDTGNIEDYYQCGSCKSEDTFAESNLFFSDNYDFTPVFGTEYGVIFRRHAYLNKDYKRVQKVDEMWQGPLYHIVEPTSVQLLQSNEDVRRATRQCFPIVAQTELIDCKPGYRAIIEYPIKTMNINDAKDLYQIDTGPVLLPDFSSPFECSAETLQLAYVAFNNSQFADFVIEKPTTIVENGCDVCKIYHYSGVLSLPAINTLYAIV
jgi:hypothetical protein